MSMKEENLIQYPGTLKPGQRLVKVGNTFMPVGVGGAFEPGSGGGGSMKFYKCASVDTDNKTWSGYELVLRDGFYEVSQTLTNNLIYTGMIPVVDLIYSEDATLLLDKYVENPNAIPTQGLVFYAPLDNVSSSAATGQELTFTGNLTYNMVAGVPCAYFDGNSYFSVAGGAINGTVTPEESTDSIWLRVADGKSFSYLMALCEPQDGTNYYHLMALSQGYLCEGLVVDTGYDVYKWHHVTIVRQLNNNFSMYIDGVLAKTATFGTYVPNSTRRRDYGRTEWTGFGRENWNGYMAGIRSYNRALTQEEITALSREFKSGV